MAHQHIKPTKAQLKTMSHRTLLDADLVAQHNLAVQPMHMAVVSCLAEHRAAKLCALQANGTSCFLLHIFIKQNATRCALVCATEPTRGQECGKSWGKGKHAVATCYALISLRLDSTGHTILKMAYVQSVNDES